MNWKLGCAAGALALMLPAAAAMSQDMAQSRGFYVQGGAGMGWADDMDGEGTQRRVDFDNPGWLGAAAVGYDFGWPRVEIEGSYRNNNPETLRSDVEVWGAMVNVLADLDFGFPVVPYIGAGIGWAWQDNELGTDDALAYQGIAGLGYAITPNLTLFADYRYFATDNMKTKEGARRVDDNYSSHNALFGVRFTFGAPAPAAKPVAAPPPPPPPPAPAPRVERPAPAPVVRSYLVFFDFDRSNLTPEAQRIVRTAADNAKTASVTRINVTGHADRSGSAAYNQRLSMRRAESVKAELIRNGLRPNEIAVFAKGETDPLVPTPDGVREPQNRRVEIVYQ